MNTTAISAAPERKYYNGVSFFKFLCMFLIVAVHTEPFREFNWRIGDFAVSDIFYNWCSRAALSFYFMTSGFLLARNTKYSVMTGKGYFRPFIRYILGALRLYIIWIFIYAPISNAGQPSFLNEIFQTYTFSDLFSLLSKKILLTGTFEHLWFMPAVIISMIIVWFLGVRTKGIAPLAIAAFVYVFFVLAQNFADAHAWVAQGKTLLGDNYGLLRRIFGSGFPFVAVGFFLGNFEIDRLKEYFNLKIAAVIVTVVYFAEFVLIGRPNPIITFVLPFMTATLLILSANIAPKWLTAERAKMFAVLSSGIYMAHFLFMQYLVVFFGTFDL